MADLAYLNVSIVYQRPTDDITVEWVAEGLQDPRETTGGPGKFQLENGLDSVTIRITKDGKSPYNVDFKDITVENGVQVNGQSTGVPQKFSRIKVQDYNSYSLTLILRGGIGGSAPEDFVYTKSFYKPGPIRDLRFERSGSNTSIKWRRPLLPSSRPLNYYIESSTNLESSFTSSDIIRRSTQSDLFKVLDTKWDFKFEVFAEDSDSDVVGPTSKIEQKEWVDKIPSLYLDRVSPIVGLFGENLGLYWELETESNDLFFFDIQQSKNGGGWETLGEGEGTYTGIYSTLKKKDQQIPGFSNSTFYKYNFSLFEFDLYSIQFRVRPFSIQTGKPGKWTTSEVISISIYEVPSKIPQIVAFIQKQNHYKLQWQQSHHHLNDVIYILERQIDDGPWVEIFRELNVSVYEDQSFPTSWKTAQYRVCGRSSTQGTQGEWRTSNVLDNLGESVVLKMSNQQVSMTTVSMDPTIKNIIINSNGKKFFYPTMEVSLKGSLKERIHDEESKKIIRLWESQWEDTDFKFEGGPITKKLPVGKYLFECWGGAAGNNNRGGGASSIGGRGAYVSVIFNNTTPSDIEISTGGRGLDVPTAFRGPTQNAGWPGGGNSPNCPKSGGGVHNSGGGGPSYILIDGELIVGAAGGGATPCVGTGGSSPNLSVVVVNDVSRERCGDRYPAYPMDGQADNIFPRLPTGGSGGECGMGNGYVGAPGGHSSWDDSKATLVTATPGVCSGVGLVKVTVYHETN